MRFALSFLRHFLGEGNLRFSPHLFHFAADFVTFSYTKMKIFPYS